MYIGVSCPERVTVNEFEVVRERLFPIHSTQMPVMACTIQPKGSSKEEMTLDTSQ